LPDLPRESNVTSGRVGLTGGDREARGLGVAMSAGHATRRQNYSFVAVTPAVAKSTSSTHVARFIVAIISAIILDIATFATITMFLSGK
jgi:hypothetical protein